MSLPTLHLRNLRNLWFLSFFPVLDEMSEAATRDRSASSRQDCRGQLSVERSRRHYKPQDPSFPFLNS
jgi:hypothetical protein